jgi:hypothetical protein
MRECLKIEVSGAAEGGQSWASFEDQRRTDAVESEFPLAAPVPGLIQGYTKRSSSVDELMSPVFDTYYGT